MEIKFNRFALCIVLALAASCGGSDDVPLDGDGGAGDGDGGGGGDGDGGPTPDAVVGGECGADRTQCNNCLDDDDDGLTDGFDPECTGVQDDDEGSFATGIPGDNSDTGKQDCFFDGDSGGMCQVDTCCLFAEGECPIDDPPNDCDFDLACIEECLPLVPAGCDCFGCCTVCNDNGCFDILGNTGLAPNCDDSTLGTEDDECPRCEKFEDCSAEECNADLDDCILCPGEDASDLPEGCEGNNECPGGAPTCGDGTECSTSEYCQSGCCVSVIE